MELNRKQIGLVVDAMDRQLVRLRGMVQHHADNWTKAESRVKIADSVASVYMVPAEQANDHDRYLNGLLHKGRQQASQRSYAAQNRVIKSKEDLVAFEQAMTAINTSKSLLAYYEQSNSSE